MCLCWEGGWVGCWVWMGVGRPYPPVRNDIVTQRQLFRITSLRLKKKEHRGVTILNRMTEAAFNLGEKEKLIKAQFN